MTTLGDLGVLGEKKEYIESTSPEYKKLDNDDYVGNMLNGEYNDVYDKFSKTPLKNILSKIDIFKELVDNCQASIAETDISAQRKEYRKDLLVRAKALIKELPNLMKEEI